MEADAEAYSELNKPQTTEGCKFVQELGLRAEDKVLDMGCGTGDVTKYIAQSICPAGQAIGVDPDEARIKIAKEKFKEMTNLEFYIGSSATGFPHENEPYYDAHISTSAFHWVNDDEKKIYMKKAYECLKSGGKLAILAALKHETESQDENNKLNYYPLTMEGYQKIFQEFGMFTNVEMKLVANPLRCDSYEELKRWVQASAHIDVDSMTSAKEKLDQVISIQDDGSVIVRHPGVSITACKV